MKFVVVNLPVRYKHKKYNVGDIIEIEESDIKNLSSGNLKILESPKNNQKKVDILMPVSENTADEKKTPEKDEAIETASEEVKTHEDNVTDQKEDLKEEKASDEKKEVKRTDKKKSGGKK